MKFCLLPSMTRMVRHSSFVRTLPAIFIGATLVALFFGGGILGPAVQCGPDKMGAGPQVLAEYKLIFWTVVALVLIAIGPNSYRYRKNFTDSKTFTMVSECE